MLTTRTHIRIAALAALTALAWGGTRLAAEIDTHQRHLDRAQQTDVRHDGQVQLLVGEHASRLDRGVERVSCRMNPSSWAGEYNCEIAGGAAAGGWVLPLPIRMRGADVAGFAIHATGKIEVYAVPGPLDAARTALEIRAAMQKVRDTLETAPHGYHYWQLRKLGEKIAAGGVQPAATR